MAVREQIASLKIQTSLEHWRLFRAWASVRDTPGGQSVDILVTQETQGTAPPDAPDTYQLSVRVDNDATVVRTFTLDGSLATQTVTFWMTKDGTSTGAGRSGTFRLRLFAQRTSGLNQYTVQSDDASSDSLPAGWTVTTRDQGWIYGTTTVVVSLSNISAGGGKNSPFAVDDKMYWRATFAHPPIKQWSVTAKLNDQGGVTTRRSSDALTVGDSATVDVTWQGTSTISGRVNRTFPKGALVYETRIALGNAALTGFPWTRLTAETHDTATIDPTTNIDHHLQVEDPAYGTPPGSKDVTPKRFASDALPFFGFRLTNVRGEGVNGVAARETLRDADQLLPATIDRTTTAATVNGEAGWAPTLSSTQQSKPGGAYDHTIAITTSDLTGLEANPTITVTMLRGNPSLTEVVSGGPVNISTHVYAGGAFQAGMSMIDGSKKQRHKLVSVEVAIVRLQDSGANAGLSEYLAADGSWVPLGNADFSLDNIYFHPCTETRPDSNVFVRQWSSVDTAGWGGYDLFVIGVGIDESGTPYVSSTKEIVVGKSHDHSKPEPSSTQWLGIP